MLQELEDKINTALAEFMQTRAWMCITRMAMYMGAWKTTSCTKSGSSVLGAEGKKALGSLAGVLNDYPDLKIVIVGVILTTPNSRKGAMDN